MFIFIFLLINNSTLLHCAEKRCFDRFPAGSWWFFYFYLYVYIVISIMFKPLVYMNAIYVYMSSGGEGKNWKYIYLFTRDLKREYWYDLCSSTKNNLWLRNRQDSACYRRLINLLDRVQRSMPCPRPAAGAACNYADPGGGATQRRYRKPTHSTDKSRGHNNTSTENQQGSNTWT